MRGKGKPGFAIIREVGLYVSEATICQWTVALATKDGRCRRSSVVGRPPQIHFCSRASLLMTGISGVLPVSA